MQKKRKAQEAFVEPKPRLSAIAVAKARAAQLQEEALSAQETKSEAGTQSPRDGGPGDARVLTTLLSTFPLSSAHEAASEDDDNGVGYSSDEQIWTESSTTKSHRAASQPRELSTYRPSKKSIISDKPGRLVLKLKADETVTFIGEYDIEVITGITVVYGAAIRAGDNPRRIFAPSTHALPTITAKGGAAEIAIVSTGLSMIGLNKLSPLWGRIWNARDSRESNSDEDGSMARSFMLLRSSTDDPLKRTLTPLDLPNSLQSVLSALIKPIISGPPTPPPAILVSGPKASGKSTISRYLTNTYLTSPPTDQTKTSFWLDLDPGQPEFSAPGQVSLLQLSSPILGPPFTHPFSTARSATQRLIRSHTLASITPKEDSDHFLACALDLITHYRRLRYSFSQAPLVINCSGWILGSAVDVLLHLIRNLYVTDAVLMAPMDPITVSEIEALLSRGRVMVIPQRDSRLIQIRTSAEFRAMNTQSYFHSSVAPLPSTSSPGTSDGRGSEGQMWDRRPLSRITPWLVKYTGPDAGVFAIASYGEALDPAFVGTVLNGMIVALCVIDDDAAFTSLLTPVGEQGEDEQEEVGERGDAAEPESLVTRSTPEGLPLLSPGRDGIVAPLDPVYTRCLGLALVRGIDSVNGELQLLTPVPKEEILDAIGLGEGEEEEQGWETVGEHRSGGRKKGGRIVLVRGKFDCPDWAFLEDVYAGVEVEGAERPYVAERKVGAEAGLGGNVWRVRHLPRKMGGDGGGGGGG